MKRTSISRAFILRVLLILLACQGILFGWSYILEEQTLDDGLSQKVSLVSRLLVNASVKGLTEFDVTYLGLLADEMLKDKDFSGLMLFDDAGLNVVDRKKPGVVGQIKAIVPVTQGASQIGRLEIYYNKDRIERQMSEALLMKAGIQGIILVLIAIVIAGYFRFKVARRITSIDKVIQQMTDGDLRVRIGDNTLDELGAISDGVDLLGQRLADSVSKIFTFSENVNITTETLNAAFNETRIALAHQHDSTEEISRAVSSATGNQTQISLNARRLLDFSRSNATEISENLNLSQGIANKIVTLHSGMNEAYDTVLAIDTSAKGVAALAGQAAYAVEDAVDSASAIKASFAEIERIVAVSSQLSEQTTQIITDKGIVAVAEAQLSMTKIFDLSESLRQTIAKLGEESKDIAKILSVISEITDKTKLLSLNASIIAAQAGEHGLGFAVVANEMKLLSDKTAHSTTEISSILGTIHHDIADAVRETGEATHIVQEGSQVVAHAGLALQEILSASQNSQERVSYIKEATGLQQDKLRQVVEALDKLREVNISVSQASIIEETNIGAVGRSIGELRDVMEQVRSAAEQQVASMQEMLRNIESSTTRTSEISTAVHEAQQVNGAICASLRDVVDIGAQTVSALVVAADRVDAVQNEVTHLREEMKQFRV